MPSSTNSPIISSTAQIADGTIVNADINATAAIDESKVAFATNDGSRHDHSAADITTGTLSTTRGGTGISNPTAKGLVRAQGASAMDIIAPGAANTVIKSDGTDWAAGTVPTPLNQYNGATVSISPGQSNFGIMRTLSNVPAMTAASIVRFRMGYIAGSEGAGRSVKWVVNGTDVALWAAANTQFDYAELELYSLNSTSSQFYRAEFYSGSGIVRASTGTLAINLGSTYTVTFQGKDTGFAPTYQSYFGAVEYLS